MCSGSDLRELLAPARALAHKVATFIQEERKRFRANRVEFKPDHSMVSYVDRQAEDMLVKGLRPLIPNADFITEEAHPTPSKGKSYVWVVDPLDGTTNFVHQVPYYCTSFALVHAQEVLFGLTYEIPTGLVFYALKGQGAFCNGAPLQVAQPIPVAPMYYALPFSTPEGEQERLLRLVRHIQAQNHSFRRMGSAALSLAYTAAGRFDALFDLGLKAWDMAAGILLVQEAGGRVSDKDGQLRSPTSHGNILAGAPHAYQKLYDQIQRIWNPAQAA